MPSGRAIQLNGVVFVTTDRNVRLNGETHKVPVEEYQPEVFVEQFDTSGGQSQQQLRGKDSQIFPNLSLGFGRNRVESDSARNPDEYRRFLDATADTRFAGDIRLPILEEDSTETGLEVVRAFANFKGDFWSIWEDGTGLLLVARKYTGSTTTWEGGGQVRDPVGSNNAVGLDIISHKDRMVVVNYDENDHFTSQSTDGITWTASTTQPTVNLFSDNAALHEDINGGLLAEIGNELVLIAWHEANGTITFFSSTDAGVTFADEAVDIPSGDGPHGVGVYPGIDGVKKLYVLTMEGLWEVNTVPGSWTIDLIFATPGGIATYGRRMIVGDDGALWFSVGVDDDTPAPFYRMVVEGDSRAITPVGLDLGDGVIAEMLGPVRYMTSAGGFQWAAIGGGKASRNARIVCWNGRGWHSMRRHGTANEKIEAIGVSSHDDDTIRLHYAIRTGSAVSNTKFLGQPLVNPRSGVTIAREVTGYIDLPFIDGGMPLISGAWLRIGISAEDLSATNSGEFIDVKYGKDGEARTVNDAGDILSATSELRLPSATPGLGEKSNALGIRLVLNRNDDTPTSDTPKVKDIVVTYLKQPPVQEGFILMVDIAASAKIKNGPGEEVWTTLKTARDLGTLVKYRYASATTDQFVKIRDIRWSPKQRSGARASPHTASDPLIKRDGFAMLTIEEVDAD